MEAVELQLDGGDHGAAVCSVAVAPDVRWGVWEVLFGSEMQAPGGGGGGSSSSSSSSSSSTAPLIKDESARVLDSTWQPVTR